MQNYKNTVHQHRKHKEKHTNGNHGVGVRQESSLIHRTSMLLSLARKFSSEHSVEIHHGRVR